MFINDFMAKTCAAAFIQNEYDKKKKQFQKPNIYYFQ